MSDQDNDITLTVKQQRFIDEYLVDFSKTKAAIRAGYSKKTAYSIGNELAKKPEIKAEIDRRLEELSLSAKETTKLISDIAKSSLNEYFTVTEVYRRPEVKKPLRDVILDMHEQIEDADKFISRTSNVSAEELEYHNATQESRRREILKLEIELERNPKAYRLVSGDPELVKVAELDLPRLVSDKSAGRIKSIKPTEHGINVELYAADGALRDLARIHGLFNDKIEVDIKGQLMNLYKNVMSDDPDA